MNSKTSDNTTPVDTSESPADYEFPPPPITLIDRILLLPFLVVFVGVLLCFEPLLRVAGLFGLSAVERVAAGLNRSVVFSLRILGTKFDISGEFPVSRDTNYVIIANHQSMFDISTIYSIFAAIYPRFVAKKELSRIIPSISYVLRNDGSAIIDRKNPAQALPELKALSERAKQNRFAIVIFPEGTRARNGKLKEFKSRGLSTILEMLPYSQIIPVAIDGSWKLQAYPHGPIPHGVTIHIRIGQPLAHAQTVDKTQVVAHTRNLVRDMLCKIRLNR